MTTTQQERELKKSNNRKLTDYNAIEKAVQKIHDEDFDHIRVFTHMANDDELIEIGRAVMKILYGH